MELDITEFFNNAAPMDYSASVAEIGAGAGNATWQTACNDSAEYCILDNPAKLEAAREFFGEFGAWSEEELKAMPDSEVNALLLQIIAGDIREFCEDTSAWDWEAYEEESKNGQISGRIFSGDENRVYYYIGN